MQLFKNILICLMVVNTLGSTLTVPLIYMDYTARQDYIATVLCVNKDKPMLNCNGKCYLAKKLKAAKEQQEKENQIHFKSEITFFAQDLISFKSQQEIEDLVSNYFINTCDGRVRVFITSVFHPPIV